MSHPAPEALRERVSRAPRAPGVYTFSDAAGRPLYIGKAKSLRHRLQSHLRDPKTRGGADLLRQTASLDWVLTASEWEALLLEQELIHLRQPRYNVSLRHGRRYPRIGISWDEEYPRVYLDREPPHPERRYYGPYSTEHARQILKLLGRLFRPRTCEGPQPGRASGSPCLDYHIGRCDAPCVGLISRESYREKIAACEAVLRGEWADAEKVISERMSEASERQMYEQAAALRDTLAALGEIRGRAEHPGLRAVPDCDAITITRLGDGVELGVLSVRAGALASQQKTPLAGIRAGADPARWSPEQRAEIYFSAISEIYRSGVTPPPVILVTPEPSGSEWELLKRLLQERRRRAGASPRSVRIRSPKRGALAEVMRLAIRNAEESQRLRIGEPSKEPALDASTDTPAARPGAGSERP